MTIELLFSGLGLPTGELPVAVGGLLDSSSIGIISSVNSDTRVNFRRRYN